MRFISVYKSEISNDTILKFLPAAHMGNPASISSYAYALLDVAGEG